MDYSIVTIVDISFINNGYCLFLTNQENEKIIIKILLDSHVPYDRHMKQNVSIKLTSMNNTDGLNLTNKNNADNDEVFSIIRNKIRVAADQRSGWKKN